MLGVVIVTYNPGQNLGVTVGALADAVRVVVVDNHSGEDGRRRLEGLAGAHLDRVDLDDNYGIARALNLGLTRLLAAGCEWAVTLDQDSRLGPGYLRRATELAAGAEPTVAMLCPRIVEDGGGQVYQGCPSAGGGPCEVDFAITSGSVVRIRDVLRLGGFDDELFIDYVDFDLCLRLRGAGKRLLLHEDLVLEHKIGAPLRRRLLGREVVSLNHSPIRRYYKHRNLPLLLARNRQVPAPWVARKTLSHLIEPFKIALLEQQRTEKLGLTLLGTLDGLRGKTDRFSARGRRSPMRDTRVSVCLASYNGERYIFEQLTSILGQLGPQDEIIIQDDCSSDETENVIRSLGDSRIKLERNPENLGVVRTFERALRRATGDIIFLSDQDDLWLPWKMQEMLHHFAKHPAAVLVVGDAVLVDEQENILAGSYFDLLGSRPGVVKNIVKNTFVGCCLAFRRKVLLAALPLPTEPRSHDGWLGAIAGLMGEVSFLPVSTIYYRRHGGNASSLTRSPLGDILRRRGSLMKHLLTRLPLVVKVRNGVFQ